MEVNGNMFGYFHNNTVLMTETNMKKGYHFMNTLGIHVNNNFANGNSTFHGTGFVFC